MNTADYLLEIGKDESVALISGKSEYNYSDLRKASVNIAEALLAQGISSADRVGLLGAER